MAENCLSDPRFALTSLPDEMILELVAPTPEIWFKVCESVPFVGVLTHCKRTMTRIRKIFLSVLVTDLGKFYYINNLLHRDDGPAVEWTDGEKWTYRDGVLLEMQLRDNSTLWPRPSIQLSFRPRGHHQI
jgi:hypothetical protein